MKNIFLVLFISLCLYGPTKAQEKGLDFPIRPLNTFSIVAFDKETGEFGAGVQSHWFSVGGSVIWAEPGVGAVATQSFTEVTYGPLGLELMRAGKTAPESLKALLSADEHTDVRQVGMIDAMGNRVNHTGENAIAEVCGKTGEGYSAQANMMMNSTVCEAMGAAFEATDGDLAERIMAALEAAQKEGGDARGQQSAALLVVGGPKGTPLWEGKEFDLRIEDHAEPIKEMRRLLDVARAYKLMDLGDGYMTTGDFDLALKAYSKAEKMQPQNHEMIFWHAATLAAIDRVEESLPLFDRAFEMWPDWRIMVKRLPEAGLLPKDPEVINKILEAR